jgi:hypothetical protein
MTTLFVYFKLPADQHEALRPVAQAFQARAMQTWPGLSCELMQRPEATAEQIETWMEVYHHPNGVDPQMMQGIGELAVQMGMPPKRMAEVFIPLR